MEARPWTVRTLLAETTRFLAGKGIHSARLDAELLLARALGCGRIDLYLDFDKPLSNGELDAFRELVRRRGRREPVAYILGEKEFYGILFAVGPGVLVPRPETEHLVDAALADVGVSGRARDPLSILDLGTGSGSILLALLSRLENACGVGVDREPAALAWANRNAARLGLQSRARFVRGSWFDAILPDARFDLVVANPPYVAPEEWPGLAPEITHFEPESALVSQEKGTADLRALARDVERHLAPEGRVYLEVGMDQGARVAGLLAASAGLVSVDVLPDYGGRDRVVRAAAAPERARGGPGGRDAVLLGV
ncbi:MAG: peptide chain release factor N(5)-glutamine methyltransferase [Planctomycetes bacterium]|nr:peptide chain release factor N(5)-glutamine methyltransferase [Planctomycetota bacterium]